MESNQHDPGDLDAAICEEMSKSLRRQQCPTTPDYINDKLNIAIKEGMQIDTAIGDIGVPVTSKNKPPTVRSRGGRSRDETESDHFYSISYLSRTDATSSSSSETDTSSEDEKIIEEFASRYPPQQKLSFISGVRPSRRRKPSSGEQKSVSSSTAFVQPFTSESSSPLQPGESTAASSSAQSGSIRPPLPSSGKPSTGKDTKRRRVRRSVAANRRSALLRCMRQYKQECTHLENEILKSASPGVVPGPFSGPIPFPDAKHPLPIVQLGHLWAEILPLVVSGFLDLKSVVNLRQCCKRLYYKRRFEQLCTLTEQELTTKVLPSLKTFLTAGSLAQFNFSRCCLLTDTFPKAIVSFQNGRLRRHLRALYFDFCYALTDKALETLLSTSLPNLEIFSLRCARSRDLTGAPFSQKDLLSKERWPRFHQFSCSCTQMALPHLDSVALFVAERAVELQVPPKLGIAGSLASNSLIRRLGLELEHQTFIESIVVDGSPEAVENAIYAFEKQWSKNFDEGENKNKVLHRLLRNRSIPILINAPCSMAVVDDGEGHEKAMWLLMSNRRKSQLTRAQVKEQLFAPPYGSNQPAPTANVSSPTYPALFEVTEDKSSSLPEQCCSCHRQVARPVGSDEAPTPVRIAFAGDVRSASRKPTADVTPASPSAATNASFSTSETRPLRPPLPTVKASAASPMADISGTETDLGYSVSTKLQIRQANYSRWSYPLPMAIRLGNLPVVHLLLQRGAHLDVWGYNFATPLYIAVANAQRFDPGTVLSKLASNDDSFSLYSVPVHDDPDLRDDTSDAESPQGLPIAITSADVSSTNVTPKQDITIVESIVQQQQQQLSNSGLSSPISATSNVALDVESEMIRDASCSCQCHSLYQDVKDLEQRNAIVDLLLKCGAPVDAPDLYSVKCPINAAIKNDNQPLLETLIAAGARINVRALPSGVIPPLIQVSRRQQEKKQPKIGLTRLGYKSPLFYACELNARHCIEVLLDAGADPHWRDPFSNRNVTPTLLAYRKDPQMLQLFVRKNAGSARATRWVLSEVLAAAILQDDTVAIQFLVSTYKDLLERESSGMWSLPLIQAARLNKVSVLQTLLDLGADPSAVNSQGLTALHFAASEGHRQAIECLLQRGAKPNVSGGSNSRTPIHIAAEENRRDCAEVLLNYGADITLKDSSGLTPVMTAIASRNDKVAMLLIQRGTTDQLNVSDTSQRTALMYAIYFGQFKVADALVERGVSCSAMDNSGCTAEFLLKQKVQSLGKSSTSTSTINKILRNIVGAGGQPSGGASRGKSSDAEKEQAADKTQNPQMSEESVRKLNAKRKKIARRLLKKIRAKAKKDFGVLSTSTSVVTTPIASPPKPLLVKELSTTSPEDKIITTPLDGNLNEQLSRSAGEIKSPELSVLQRVDSLKRTDSTSAETKRPCGDKQRVVSGDSPIGSSPAGFVIGQKISDERSLDCSWGESSGGEHEDDLSSVSSASSDSSSDSEK